MLIQAKEATSGVSIEMTPMIDMVFLLLIFFLVATTFQQTEREMQIALPFASSSEPISTQLQDPRISDPIQRLLRKGEIDDSVSNLVRTDWLPQALGHGILTYILVPYLEAHQSEDRLQPWVR